MFAWSSSPTKRNLGISKIPIIRPCCSLTDEHHDRPGTLSEVQQLCLTHAEAEIIDNDVAESRKTVGNDEAEELQDEVQPDYRVLESYEHQQ